MTVIEEKVTLPEYPLFKVIVAGSRDFNDYHFAQAKLNAILVNKHRAVQIVSGGAKGADKIGEMYGKIQGYEVVRFPADWDKYGKGAGHIRNKEMADYADGLVAFWDGKSAGTKNMIEIAKAKGLVVRVVEYTVKGEEV